jgi:DNA-binding response OmpR family regulator
LPIRFTGASKLSSYFRPDTQYLRVYIGKLRQKVEEHPDDPRIILTEPGIGCRIAES